jgi:hypothetical protein
MNSHYPTVVKEIENNYDSQSISASFFGKDDDYSHGQKLVLL